MVSPRRDAILYAPPQKKKKQPKLLATALHHTLFHYEIYIARNLAHYETNRHIIESTKLSRDDKHGVH